MVIITDLPLELISKITLSVNDPKSFRQLLLSNTIFRQSISEKQLKQKRDIYVWDYPFTRLQPEKSSVKFNHPCGIALDSCGNIIVSDNNNHRLQMFGKNGEFIKTIGSYGCFVGNLFNPEGITTIHDNNVEYICVADTGNRRISVFNSDDGTHAKFKFEAKTTIFMPCGLTTNNEGHAVVSTWGSGKISIFGDVNNEHVPIVKSFDPHNGKGYLKFPSDICVDQNDNIIVMDQYTYSVNIFDREGKFVMELGSCGNKDNKIQYPWGVCINKRNGQILTTDNGSRQSKIGIWSSDGQFIRNIYTLSSSPKWIAVTKSGKKAIVSFNDHTVQCIPL